MTVFLTILKVLGIVLLSLLALAVIVLLIILFVPIRYRIKSYVRAEENYYDADCDLTWILHLFHGRIRFLRSMMEDEAEEGNKEDTEKQGLHYELRLLHFIKLLPGKDREEEEEYDYYGGESPSWEEERKWETSAVEDRTEETAPEEKALPEEWESRKIEEAEKEPEEEPEEGPEEKPEEEPVEEPEEEPEEKKGILQKIREFFSMLKGLIKGGKKKAGYKINDICDKIGELKGRGDHIARLFNDERSAEAVKLGLNELFRLLRALKPRKYRAEFIYGFDDPALTGEATGILSMLFLSFGKNVILIPDFERFVVDGDMFLKGRLRIITLVIILWKLYFNKNFRRFLREVRSL